MAVRSQKRYEQDMSKITDLDSFIQRRERHEKKIMQLCTELQSPTSTDLKVLVLASVELVATTISTLREKIDILDKRISDVAEEKNVDVELTTLSRQAYALAVQYEELHHALQTYLKLNQLEDSASHLEQDAKDVGFEDIEPDYSKQKALYDAVLGELKGSKKYPDVRNAVEAIRTSLQSVKLHLASKRKAQEDQKSEKERQQKAEEAAEKEKQRQHDLEMAKLTRDSKTTVVTSADSVPKASKPKIRYPKFNGRTLDWQRFWSVFSGLIDQQTDLLNSEKTCLLAEAMEKDKDRQMVLGAAGNSMDYDKAVISLQSLYQCNRAVFAEAHRSFFTENRRIHHNREDLGYLLLLYRDTCTAMDEAKGISRGQLMVQHIKALFDQRVADK